MRYAFIESHRAEFTVERMCKVLQASRSGYYDWRTRKPSLRAQENAVLRNELVRIHQQSRETYGGRKLWQELLARGYHCGRHRGVQGQSNNLLRTVVVTRRVSRFLTDG